MLVPRPYGRLALWLLLYIVLISYFVLLPTDRSQILRTPKFLPTDFSAHAQSLDQFECPSQLCPEKPRHRLDMLYESSRERYIFKRMLSSGFEGTVSIYNDTRISQEVAIKSFYIHRSPLRNILSDTAATFFGTRRWPTELQFMLLYANQLHDQETDPANNSLVNVKDYFIVDDGVLKQWQLVTQFYQHGTLHSAGPKIAQLLKITPAITTSDLDVMFRKSFEALLQTLTSIHGQGYCHDDIKPANIFISDDPLHWLLGDFGNVREKDHPYHESKMWIQQNQWKDCEKNDIRRLIMVYLSFLRSFHTDTSVFDSEFLKGREGWAKLYWDYVLKQQGGFVRTTPWYAPARLMLPSNQAAKVQADKLLHCSFRTWSGRLFDRFLLLH